MSEIKDLRELIIRYRRALIRWGLVCALLAVGVRLLREPYYESVALFADGKSSSKEGALFKKMGLAHLGLAEGHAQAGLMTSRVLGDAVAALGQQIAYKKEGRFHKLLSQIRAEFGADFLPFETPIFREVHYEAALPLTLQLIFLDRVRFTVKDEAGITLGLGRVGQPFDWGAGRFTLKSLPKPLKRMSITIQPKWEIVARYRKQLRIKPYPLDHQLLLCRYRDRRREESREFLQALFAAYERSLDQENEMKSQRDLSYLMGRRDALFSELQSEVDHYVTYLKEGVLERGYLQCEKEVEMRQTQRASLEKRLLAIAEEKKQLEGATLALALPPSPFARKIEKLSLKQLDLIKRKESLKVNTLPFIALHAESLPSCYEELDLPSAENLFSHYQLQRDQLQMRSQEIERLLAHFSFSKAKEILGTTSHVEEGLRLEKALQEPHLFSEKERERQQTEISFMADWLKNESHERMEHIAEQQRLTDRKLQQIKKSLVHLLDREIDICDKQIAQTVALRKEALDEQRLHIEGQIAALQREISALPEKWQGEKQLSLKAELGQAVMSRLTKLIESKRVEDQLGRLECKVFDPPLLPLQPLKPFLLLYAFLGFIVGFSMRLFFLFLNVSL